jgi:serine/threonine-protein kinase
VAPVPTTLLDLPLPMGCNAEAVTQFRAGIHAQHDGNWEEAQARYEAAVNADSECAAAHLRLTIVGYPEYSAARTREIYQRAIQLRSSLNERDRQLLDALDPLVRRDPTDTRAFAARMLALAEQYPGDAEIVHLSAGEFDVDFDAQITRARAAIALDPHYSDAWQALAGGHKHKGELDAAVAALDECLRLAPNSVDCIRERNDLARRSGRCDEMVTHAQRWVARAPKSADGYLTLARGLGAQGASADTIEEALRQRWSRLSEPERLREQPVEEALLNALTGRFDRAAEWGRDAARLSEADASYEPRVGPVLLLANTALETNQVDKAAELAVDFLTRKDAWSKLLRRGSKGVKLFHIEPLLLDIQYRAGRLTQASWKAARATWVSTTRGTGRFSEETIWAVGIAMAAQNHAEAVKALESMPASLQADPLILHPDILPAVAFAGRAFLLADRIDEALVLLRRAVSHCDALETPFEDTQANLWLGQALEKKGDRSGACAAYQVVRRRWGRATPSSVTAAAAKERSRALGCAD